jgi:hypothetical protein
LLFILTALFAQEKVDIGRSGTLNDSIGKLKLIAADSVILVSKNENEFKPDPIKVVWMGAIFPGYGQIMNRKYWKIPIVYGGFLGCAYAISMNSTRYQTYKTAYRDIIDTDPNTNSFIQIIPRGYTIESYGGISGYTNILKTGQDNYRRYRDLSIIATIGYYALTLVDAYVDAQLYDFDISPDLSLHFQPVLLDNTNGYKNAIGMQCSFRLK